LFSEPDINVTIVSVGFGLLTVPGIRFVLAAAGLVLAAKRGQTTGRDR
jgi:hypothetical protein